MKKLFSNKLLAGVLTGILLFSNYGVMGFADDVTPTTATVQDTAPGATEAPVITPGNVDVVITETSVKDPNDDSSKNPILNNQVKFTNLTSNPGDSGDQVKETKVEGTEGTQNKTYNTVVFDLVNVTTGSELDVNGYCNDIKTNLQNNSVYNIDELTNLTPGNVMLEGQGNLRGIVLKGYDPKNTIASYIAELPENLSGKSMSGLEKEEAIAATQLAIWRLNNPGKNLTPINDEGGRVDALANYLLLQKAEAPKHDLKITAAPVVDDANKGITLEGKEVELNYNYSVNAAANQKVIETIFKVFISQNDGIFEETNAYTLTDGLSGSKNLSLTKIIDNVKMRARIEVTGTYQVEEVYDLVPINPVATTGQSNSYTQRLVSTPMLMSYNLPTLTQIFEFNYNLPQIRTGGGGSNGGGTPGGGGGGDNGDGTRQTSFDREERVVLDTPENIIDQPLPLAAPDTTQVAVVTPVVEIEDVIVPLAVPVVDPPVIDVVAEKVPKGAPELPKTGGFAPELLYALSLGLIGVGFKLKK